MVRIRVKLTQHDGAPKRELLWQGINKVDAYVYKMIAARDAFYLVTDTDQVEKLLKEDIREFLRG